jgi:hypothetical protein
MTRSFSHNRFRVPRHKLAGKKFGHLTVLKWAGSNIHGKHFWLCLCDCGNHSKPVTSQLINGLTLSCGCINQGAKTHGKTNTPEYRVWQNMKRRCHVPSHRDYPNYGGRGITVCQRWRNSFANFLKDMGLRPSRYHSLDRIKNDEEYGPENCKWATAEEQSRNTRRNVMITAWGQTLCISQWATQIGVSCHTIHRRLLAGWTTERAVSERSRLQKRKSYEPFVFCG